MIDLFFFDFQMVCATEVAFFDYNRIRELPGKYIISVLVSLSILVLIISEFSGAFDSISREVKRRKNGIKHESGAKNDKLVVELYTEGINIGQNQGKNGGIHNYLLLIGSLRFFFIQVVIASLQLLNRSQALLVSVINLSYLIFFIKFSSSSKVFSSKLILIKEYIQEGCTMVVLMVITLFSFTERTSFSESLTYKVIELLAVFSILGACGSELVSLCLSIWENFKRCFSRKKKKNQRKIDAKNASQEKKFVGFDYEGKDFEIERRTDELKRGEKNEIFSSFARNPFSERIEKVESQRLQEEGSGNKEGKIMGRGFSKMAKSSKFGGEKKRKTKRNRKRESKMWGRLPKRSKVKAKNKLRFDKVDEGKGE